MATQRMAPKKVEVPLYEDADVYALQALDAGVASAGQQQRALQFLFRITGLRDMPTYSDNQLEMAYNNGRRYPGWLVAKLIELKGITRDLTKKES